MGIEYVITILTFTGITLIGVLGAYMVTGLTGLFSFGQAAFLAIGAYVSAVLMKDYQVALPFAMLAAIAVGVLCGLLVGLPTVRLRRDYISLVTIGFGEAIIALLTNSASITGGAMGLSGIPFPWPDGWGGLEPNAVWLIVVGISVVICLAVVVSYKYSKYGRQCLALRSDELAAKSMGINVTKLKLMTFLIAAGMTSYAGCLYAVKTSYVEPAAFGWTLSAEWIIIVFVGGINSLTGAVVSGLLLTTLPEFLRFAAEWRVVIYCVVVLLIINFRPSGLFGEWEINRLWKGGSSK